MIREFTSRHEPLVLGAAAAPRRTRRRLWRWLVGIVLLANVGLLLAIGLHTRPGGNPLAMNGFVVQQERFAGHVEETLSAGSYTYFSMRLPDRTQRWVVVLGRAHRKASDLTVKSYGYRRDYRSPKLARDFDQLYFVTVSDSKR